MSFLIQKNENVSELTPCCSAFASSVTTSSKAFKIGVTFPDGQVLYLTSTTSASPSAADAVECTMAAGALACGANKAGLTYGDFHSFEALAPTVSAPNNKGFSIAEDNTLHWAAAQAGKEVHFSLMTGAPKQLYAEICSSYGHPDKFMFTPGVAKVYYA